MRAALRLNRVVIVAVVAALAVGISIAATRPAAAHCTPMSGGPCTNNPDYEDPFYTAGDSRVNPNDAVAQMTAYCKSDHSLDVFAIYNSSGIFLFNVTQYEIAGGLSQAISTGKDAVIYEQQGNQLWALTTSELELHNSNGYDFRFAGNTCGGFDLAALIDYAKAHPIHTVRRGGRGSRATRTPVTPKARLIPTQTPTPTPTAAAPAPAAATSSAVAPSAPIPAGSGAFVTTGHLSVRLKPDSQSDLLGYIPPGATIYAEGRDVSWQWVKVTYQGLEGWVSTQFAGLTNDDLRKLPVLR
jgi:hypothetical protein